MSVKLLKTNFASTQPSSPPTSDPAANLELMVNERVASCMKKGIKLIFERFEKMYEQKVKLIVQEEMEVRVPLEVREALKGFGLETPLKELVDGGEGK